MQISIRRSFHLIFVALLLAAGVGLLLQRLVTVVMLEQNERLAVSELPRMQALKAISDSYAITIVQAALKASGGALEPAQALQAIVDTRAIIRQKQTELLRLGLSLNSPDDANDLGALTTSMDALLDQVVRALANGEAAQVVMLTSNQLQPAVKTFAEISDQLIEERQQQVRDAAATARWASESLLPVQWAIFGLLALLSLIGLSVLQLRVLGPVQRLIRQLERVASGDTQLVFPTQSKASELGSLNAAVSALHQQVVDRQRLEAHERDERRSDVSRQQEIAMLLARLPGDAIGAPTPEMDALRAAIHQDLAERRRASHRALLQVALAYGNKERVVSSIVAAARKDVTIEAVPQLSLGARLKIEWSTGERANGRVIWIGSNQAGIALERQMPIELLEIARAA